MPTQHIITWEQLAQFAKDIDREITHVFRCFKGERQSPKVSDEFEKRFGFPMSETALAGYRRRRSHAA